MKVWLVVLLAACCVAKTIVHPSVRHSQHAQAHHVKDVESQYHVNAELVDVTNHLVEIPEQSLPMRHSPMADLEEDQDQNDPTSRVVELPEQSTDATESVKPATNSNQDLERGTTAVSDDVFAENVPAGWESFGDGKIATRTPPGGQKVQGSNAWAQSQFTTDKFPQGMGNLMDDRDHHPVEVPRADAKKHYDSDAHEDEGIKFESGGVEISVHQNHAKNFLDARRVQVGTSVLGPHVANGQQRVARYRVRFVNKFQKRPIVIVTTVPEGAENISNVGPHQDVFAASVSEIRLDHFVVNVVRVDSFPDNGWGQSLYLDWIALEYDSEYPIATPPNKSWLETRNFEESPRNGTTVGAQASVGVDAWDN